MRISESTALPDSDASTNSLKLTGALGTSCVCGRRLDLPAQPGPRPSHAVWAQSALLTVKAAGQTVPGRTAASALSTRRFRPGRRKRCSSSMELQNWTDMRSFYPPFCISTEVECRSILSILLFLVTSCEKCVFSLMPGVCAGSPAEEKDVTYQETLAPASALYRFNSRG